MELRMRKRTDELKSVERFMNSMMALGEAAGHPSDKSREKMAKAEYRRAVTLAVADLALQPLVEIQNAHAEHAAQQEQDIVGTQLTDQQIRYLAEQGEGVIVYPFRS